jgi:N-acetylmuramoyl-L-alanine amidase
MRPVALLLALSVAVVGCTSSDGGDECRPGDSCEAAPVVTLSSTPSAAATSAAPTTPAPPRSYGGESVTWPRRARTSPAPPALGAIRTLARVRRSDGGTLAAGLLLPRVSRTQVLTPCGDRVSVSGRTQAVAARGSKPLVLLDPGHGGHADGTHAPDGTREADRVLDVALRAEKALAGTRVVLTRRTDHDATLPFRVALADALRPDLSVSVHLDAAPEATKPFPGTRVFGAVSDPHGRRASGVVYEPIRRYLETLSPRVGGTWASDRVPGALYRLGSRGTDYYGLLRRSHTTWVIAEPMFLSDPEEAELLEDATVRQGLAEAYAAGARAFLRGARGSGWAVPEPDPADPPPPPGQDVCTDPS